MAKKMTKRVSSKCFILQFCISFMFLDLIKMGMKSLNEVATTVDAASFQSRVCFNGTNVKNWR